jgi:hypothetical protein
VSARLHDLIQGMLLRGSIVHADALRGATLDGAELGLSSIGKTHAGAVQFFDQPAFHYVFENPCVLGDPLRRFQNGIDRDCLKQRDDSSEQACRWSIERIPSCSRNE